MVPSGYNKKGGALGTPAHCQWECTRELKAMIKKNLHMNLQQRCLQERKGSNNPNVHQQMDGQAECGGSTGRNKVVTYDTTWMHLDNIMLSEESQREMVSYCMKCSE